MIRLAALVMLLSTPAVVGALDAPRTRTESTPAGGRPDPASATSVSGSAPAAGPGGTAPTEEEVSARALERALVQRGALLLPPWRVEVVPELGYSHDSAFTAVALAAGGAALGRVRIDVVNSTVDARLGLPATLQLEAAVPFIAARRRITAGDTEQRASAAPGIADVQVSVTKHLLSTTGGGFQLLVGGAWRAPTGTSPYGIASGDLPRGSGVHALSATGTAVRISDPVVLLASVTYTASLARGTRIGRVDAGDTVKLALSSLLAITPRESLSFEVDLERGGNLYVNGARQVGTDRTSGVLQLGVSVVLSTRVLLSVSAAAGVTDDAPDLQLSVSVPIRF